MILQGVDTHHTLLQVYATGACDTPPFSLLSITFILGR